MAYDMARQLLVEINKINMSDMDYLTRQSLIDALESEVVSLGYTVQWGVMGGELVAWGV